MCGRFTRYATLEAYRDMFALESAADVPASYNIAPTQNILVARVRGGRLHADAMRWGLIPAWAKDKKIAQINARGDTVATKPMFRTAFKKRRCLILADGYYEWRAEGKAKVPFYYHMADDSPMTFAGIWETWKGEEKPIESCAIITTDANEVASKIHNRMPVILTGADREAWLDEDADPEAMTKLLTPFAGSLDVRQVAPLVNSVRNHGPELILPAISAA